MKDLLIKIKNLSIITIIASFVMGLVLLIWPDKSISIVSIITGATMIVLGVAAWISFLAKEKSVLLASAGTVSLIVGIIVCVKYQSIIAILLFLFGVFITVSGAVDLITSFYSKSVGLGAWGCVFDFVNRRSIFGIIIMVNPTKTSTALVRLAGVGLLVYAVVDLVSFIQVKKVAKEIKDEFKNIEPPIVEADAYEVDNSDEIDVDGKEI